MADVNADSPGLFAGLDTFDLGDSTLGDDGLAPDVGDDPTATTTTTTSASSSAGEATAAVSGGTPPGFANISASPSVSNGGHPPPFYNPDPSNWATFQNTPPYDSASGESPLSAAPSLAPHHTQSWELPVHQFGLNQTYLQQQQQQQQQPYFQSSPISGISPGLDTAGFTNPFAINQSHSPDISRIRNTLTPAQQERLKTIAMPPHLQYHSPKSAGSPDSGVSGSHDKGAGSSPDFAEPSKSGSRKRKSSAEVDDDDDDDDDLDGHQPVKKTAHNMIEKRYRTNLNDKIAALRDSVPALRIMSKSARGEDTTEDREELHGLTPAHKLNKATVLSKATEYIRHLEKRNNRLLDENTSMQARITAFEKLFMAGALTGQLPNPLQQPPTPVQYPHDAAFMNTPMQVPRGPEPAGVIPIPDDMKRILASQQLNAGRPYPVPAQPFGQNAALFRQQQIQQEQQQAQAQAQAGRWSPYFGKLMVGSLAGLMLVEALVENEPSNETPQGRGLLAVPLPLLSSFVRSTHFSIGGYYISAIDAIAQLRLFSLLALFLWVACSTFVDTSFSHPAGKAKQSPSLVKAVPSLASSIHVRRQAWLTAIQTVWVPQHNFLLEAAALSLKTVKYMLRNFTGDRWFLVLTGLSEEEESARIKAWTIALDAQLAGGDDEISRSRLTLTLLASGTLPETPLRMMMKALHIRVLLWWPNGALWLPDIFAAKLARSWWNEAKQLYRIFSSPHDGSDPIDEVLPKHLALLLERDCDEVLNDEIVQRAHNLAWNKHTAYKVVGRLDGMDTVVDDPAVISPIDAVAAWYSSLILQRVLVGSLPETIGSPGGAAVEDLNLAIDMAPPGSDAQIRGLVARAVLVNEMRGANILAAKQALDPFANPTRHPHYARGLPPLMEDQDAKMALDCAKVIAHLQRPADPPQEAYMVIDSILVCSTVDNMSFLGYVAAFHLMEALHQHAVCRESCSRSLERLAGGLRIWIGSSAGERSGLDAAARQKMINRCLSITKSLVGMETDPGYASMDDCDEDGEDC
ncbi:hypothetical protein B0T26DRAFT_654433 [Lasiosphaeria miniovina]|uniref:BHLH domain-containing protein n=1 Tax=Lasiosphaeria miniovina TaxID=1954250 RepID=A0AA40A5N9_9PEZI|nr:uncharacterized protein B0T26DRAFT_654433 [Lasiosphaeria miniovina]KAK0709603.1 hypothetical protein B0T26DRAFT_654433 [Lasiosphaeria miniovina]